MDDFSEPQNALERAIAGIGAGPAADPDGSARRAVLVALATNPVTVVLAEPWDGTGAPDPSTRSMYVSDGENLEQPMLAVFTRTERAAAFRREHEGFEHPCTVPGPWAIVAATEGAGIMINPNQPLGFRIVPELAQILRQDISTAIDRLSERTRAGDEIS